MTHIRQQKRLTLKLKDVKRGKYMRSSIYIAIFTFLILNVQYSSAMGQGFTVTSASTSEVFTKTTDPSTVYWLINVQIDGGGQSIVGTIDPSVIKNLMGGKVYTKKNFSINIDSVNEQVTYEIINEGVSIYKYKLESFDAQQSCMLGICWRTGDPQPCSSDANWNIQFGQTFFGYTKKRYCVTKEQMAIKGVYQNPSINFNAKIKLDLEDIVKEKTICSGSTQGCDGSSVSFDEAGTATWTGSLVTGESAPNQDNFVTINKLDSDRWQIIRRSTFESYLPSSLDADRSISSLANLFENYEDIGAGDREINSVIDSINEKTNDLLNEDTSFTSSPFEKDSNTGKVIVNLERRLTSQNIVFRIRADKIGIYIPSGQPKVLDIKTNKFRSGEEGSVDIQVQNTGDAAGTFSAMLTDCDPITQATSSQTSRKTLQPGDIDKISIIISGGNISEDITKTCSIKVYDINDPSIEIYRNVTINMERPRICAPNEIFIDGDAIKRCNNDGTVIGIVETCQYGIEYDKKGDPACSEPTLSDMMEIQISSTKMNEDVENICNTADKAGPLLMVIPEIGIVVDQVCNLIYDPKDFILNEVFKIFG